MRLKHVKGATEIVEMSSYVIHDYLSKRGAWNEVFENNHPIHVEIGMGKGQFLIENAKRFPNINFIGIEKYDSIIVRAIQKLENEKLTNIKIIRMDATRINEVFDKEIEQIYLNFSDPWPKKRHEHRRLTSKNFLDKYTYIFKSHQNIIQKTDNKELFTFSLMSFNNERFTILDLSLDYDNLDNIETEYEHKFKANGNPIYMVKVTK